MPDAPLNGDWPEPNEIGKPRFALRGLQPFHDFSVGPDWWNLQDYQSVLSQMAKLRMNFIGFHTYPSWNPAAGPEANVWIGLPEDVDAQGNVERFDYWLNLVRASQLRVRTWALAARLAAKMNEANAIQEAANKTSFARKEVLPLRLGLARSYEDLIAAFVDCARLPGELGTISGIESGSRSRLVCAHDQAMAQMLGEPLPAESSISAAYRGMPRIFVLANPTQVNAGEQQEIRAIVLSHAKCTGVNLCWRSLGQGDFKKSASVLRARRAYRAVLPAQSQDTLEYYLEASLEDGQRILWPTTAPAINQTVVVW